MKDLVEIGSRLELFVDDWLVDRLPDVIIPVINLHAVAAILVILIAVAAWLLWRSLTHSGESLLRIEGVNWSLDTQCSPDCYADLVAFANLLLLAQTGAAGPGAAADSGSR